MSTEQNLEARNKRNPLVSIAVATYNGEKFLRAQMDSLLRQTYSHFEICVSDDGSTDATVSLLEEYAQKDKRVIVSKNPHPDGFKKNFERAVSLCKGDIIFLCDQDDVWYEDKVQEHVSVYLDDESVVWVYNEVLLIDDKGGSKGYLTDLDKNYYGAISLFYKTGGRCILGCATSYRATSIKHIWPISNLAPGHDSYMQVAVYPSKYVHCHKVLQEYRQHNDNVFGVFKKVTNNVQEDVKRSIAYVLWLSKRPFFPFWKRLSFFVLYGAKLIKYSVKYRAIK